jgi:hypothetical protein
MQRIIKEGTWRYTENHFEKIILVEQDWDQFHEEGYDEDPPYLNSEGLAYYLHYGDYYYNEYGTISSRSISIPFLSQNEALSYAENNLIELKWNN